MIPAATAILLFMGHALAKNADLSVSDAQQVESLVSCFGMLHSANPSKLGPGAENAFTEMQRTDIAIDVVDNPGNPGQLIVKLTPVEGGFEVCFKAGKKVDLNGTPVDGETERGSCRPGGTVTFYRDNWTYPGADKLTFLHEFVHTRQGNPVASAYAKSCMGQIDFAAGTKGAAAQDLWNSALTAEQNANEADATAQEICELLDVCPPPPAAPAMSDPTFADKKKKICEWLQKLKDLCADFNAHVMAFEDAYSAFNTGLMQFETDYGNDCADSASPTGTDHAHPTQMKTANAFSLNTIQQNLDVYNTLVAALKAKVAAAKMAIDMQKPAKPAD